MRTTTHPLLYTLRALPCKGFGKKCAGVQYVRPKIRACQRNRAVLYWAYQEESGIERGRGGMKIHIIGGPGSGKTTLASRLSRQLGIPHVDLDDLQWDNAKGSYGTKRDPRERAALLDEILRKDDWIIEGVYHKWCAQCFADADRIVLLEIPRRTYRYRIIRRFVRRKLGLEKGKRESLKSLTALLRWADRYQQVNLPEIRQLLTPYAGKVIRQSKCVGTPSAEWTAQAGRQSRI